MMAAWKVRRAERPVQKSRRSGEDELVVMKAPCLMEGGIARGGPEGLFCVSGLWYFSCKKSPQNEDRGGVTRNV
jgi:hypothetical protein